MLDVEQTLEESQSMTGALGAVAFVALKALSTAGASTELCERFRSELFEHLAKLSDADCSVLAEVAHRRLKDRPVSGSWY